MTRFQLFIGIVTVLACLAVGIWASQRPPSVELFAEIAPPGRPILLDGPAPIDPDEALIQSILNEESSESAADAPRKLIVENERPAAEHPVRRLIAQELPDTTEEEREIWFEQLQQLPLSAVEDLFKVRRHATPLTDLPAAIAPQKIATTASGENLRSSALSAGARKALQQYRSLILQNLLNVDTIGYRAVEPRFGAFPTSTESGGTLPIEGLRWVGSRLSLKPGEFETTDRSLDLAIDGPGWFVVTDEDGKLAFTRNGSFEINDRRTLEIMTAAGPRTVHPTIAFPEKSAHVFVDSNGTIYSRLDGKTFDESPVIGQIQLARFFDDYALQLSEDGLYRPLPKAGEMVRHNPGDQCGSLREGTLERANVNVEMQQQALQRIEKWLALPTDSIRGPGP